MKLGFKEDAEQVRRLGADELFFDPTLGGPLTREAYLATMEKVRGLFPRAG